MGPLAFSYDARQRLGGQRADGIKIDNFTSAMERDVQEACCGRGKRAGRLRKNYLFMGSNNGGKSAAIAYTLIETAKLNGINPQAWLTDVLTRKAIVEGVLQGSITHSANIEQDIIG